jgi:hypothetical protein
MAIEIAPADLRRPDMIEQRKRRHTKRTLWRLCGWGGAAAIALAALAITMQTEGGAKRLQLALAYEIGPDRVIVAAIDAPRAPEKDAETKRLEAEVQKLAIDRDRLNARIASLEHNLNDVTGSIKQQATQAAPVATTPAPAASPPPVPQPVSAAPAAVPPLAVSASPAPTVPIIAPLAMPASTVAAAPWSDAASSLPSTQSSNQGATPEPVPLPPMRVADAPASEASAEPAPPASKPELGIDLGGARNMEVLSARWAAVKANFGPLLTGLHPLAVPDRRPGSTDFRLVVGPVPNGAAAARLCARFAAARVTCRPAKFAGDQLANRESN